MNTALQGELVGTTPPQRSGFSPPPAAPSGNLIAGYLVTLRRHRLAIIMFALAGGFLFLLSGLTTLPVYNTHTSVDIRPINENFFEGHSVTPTGGGTPADSDINLQTQIKLLQSDTLTESVVNHFLSQPHPTSIPRADLLSRILRTVHLGAGRTLPYDLLVQDTARRIKVKPAGLSRLVEISCDSYDPHFAAEFCNALTTTYEQEDRDARAEEARKTSQWLMRQAEDIKQRAEDSQHRLVQAVGGNGLMLSLSTTSPGEDRLRELQEELVRAQAARVEKESAQDVIRSASTDPDPAAIPIVADNPAYRTYELRLATLRGRLAELVPPLTEENPQVKHVRAEIAEAEAGLRAAQASSTTRQTNELSAARHREDLLKITYNAQLANVSSDLQKAAQVSLLRREVDSEQGLYQTLLQRSKEAGFSAALQATTVRVVDIAKPPPVPASPQRKLAGAAGLAIGSLFGIGFALYKDRSNHVFRLPGDAERYLRVQELGVIPAGVAAHRLLRRQPLSLVPVSVSDSVPQSDAIRLARWDDDFSLLAEAYRNTTLSILLAESQAQTVTRSYIVSSPSAGEGKTTITTNLGIALSKSNLNVVLIDGDLRKPRLHKIFDIENDFGFRNILRGEVDVDTLPLDKLTRRTWLSRMSVIPSGSGIGDVVDLLHSPNVSRLLSRLGREFDVVLIDTPPMIHMADARILATHTGGAILIVRAGHTAFEDASAARDLFARDGVHLVGTILNGFNPSSEGKSRYYDSYYRYRGNGKESNAA